MNKILDESIHRMCEHTINNLVAATIEAARKEAYLQGRYDVFIGRRSRYAYNRDDIIDFSRDEAVQA